MTQTQSDRLKDVQRQYAEMEHHTATLQNAQQAAEQAAWVAENNYRSLTDKCREEFRVRQQVLEGLKSERTLLLSLAVIAGGGRRVGGRVDDSSRAVAVGHLSRHPQCRVGYAGRVVELVKSWWPWLLGFVMPRKKLLLDAAISVGAQCDIAPRPQRCPCQDRYGGSLRKSWP